MAKAAAKQQATKRSEPVRDTQRNPDNAAVHQDAPAANPVPRAGQTSVNQPAKPAVSSLQRDLEQQRTADSLRDRAEGKVDSKTDESAGERRAARARVLADLPARGGRIKVRATQAGYYDHARRRPGDVFSISAETLKEDVKDGKGKIIRHAGDIAAFSDRWMERVDDHERESVSTSNDEIRRQHDEILAAKTGAGMQTGNDSDADDNVLGD